MFEEMSAFVYSWLRSVCRKWECNWASCVTDSSGVSVLVHRQSQHTVTVPFAVHRQSQHTVTVTFAVHRQSQHTVTVPFAVHWHHTHQHRKVCLSVFLSAWKNWATTGRIFVKCSKQIYLYTHKFENLSKIQAWLNHEKNASNLHENVGTVMVTSDWTVIRINSVRDKICTEIQNTFCIQ